MTILSSILIFALMFVLILICFSLCRMYVFNKIRINKYIPLVVSIILFAIQLFAGKAIFTGKINMFANYGISILAVLSFLWFMDIMQTGGPKKKEKQIQIRPKAKPNRVKKKDK